jgi:uncharacterized protein (DUF885 family)
MTPDNINTEALRTALERADLSWEGLLSAMQIHARRKLLDAAPALLAAVEAQRKEIAELRAIIGENASAAADRIRAALRGQAERDALKAEVERLRAAQESRDLIIKTLSDALGSDKTLEAFGFDRERIENARRQIAEGKFITLDQLKDELKQRAALRGEEASRG